MEVVTADIGGELPGEMTSGVGPAGEVHADLSLAHFKQRGGVWQGDGHAGNGRGGKYEKDREGLKDGVATFQTTGWQPVSRRTYRLEARITFRSFLPLHELPGGAEEVGGDDFAGGVGVGGLGDDVEEGPVGELGVLEGVGAVVGLAEGEAGIEDVHGAAGGVEGTGTGEDGDVGGAVEGVGAEGELGGPGEVQGRGEVALQDEDLGDEAV